MKLLPMTDQELAALGDNIYTDALLITEALKRHPDCGYGEVRPGLDIRFRRTRVVVLWRNEECALAGDPPRHEVEGFPA
jgi:hypothetical protein